MTQWLRKGILALAVASALAWAAPHGTAARIERTCEKQPGPTDTVVATNPSNREVPGQTEEVSNKECKEFR
jgi:hypothetical protein